MDETMKWDGLWTNASSYRPVCRHCFRDYISRPNGHSRPGIILSTTEPERFQAEYDVLPYDSWSPSSTSFPSDRDVSLIMVTNSSVGTRNNDIGKRKRLKPIKTFCVERESSSCSSSRNSAKHTQINSVSRRTYFHRNCYTATSPPRRSFESISPSSRSTSQSKSPRVRGGDGAKRGGSHRARRDLFERRRQVRGVNSVDVQTNPPSTRSFGTSPIIIQESLISIPRVSSPSNASSLTAVLEEPEERKSSDFSFVLASTRLHPQMEPKHRKTKEEEEANDRIMNSLKQIYLHDKHCTLRGPRQAFNSGHMYATRTSPPRKPRKTHRAQANRKYKLKIAPPNISETKTLNISELKDNRKEYCECDNLYIGNDEVEQQSFPQCWSESNSSLERNKVNLNVQDSYSCGLSPYLSTKVAKTYSLGTQSSLSSVWEKPDEHFECLKKTNITSEIKSKYTEEINSMSLYNRDRISLCGTQNVFLSTTKELNQSVSSNHRPEDGQGRQKVYIDQSRNTTRKISAVSKWSKSTSHTGSSYKSGNNPQNVNQTISKSGSSSDRLDSKKNPKQQKKIPRRTSPGTARRRPKSRTGPGNASERSVSSGGSSAKSPSRSASRRNFQRSKSPRSPRRTASSPTKQRGSGRPNTRGSRPPSSTRSPTRVYSGPRRGGYRRSPARAASGRSASSGGSDGSGGSKGRSRHLAGRSASRHGAGGRGKKKTYTRGTKRATQWKAGSKRATNATYRKRPPSHHSKEPTHSVRSRSAHQRERGGKSRTQRQNAGLTHDVASVPSLKMDQHTETDLDLRKGEVDKYTDNKWDCMDDETHHLLHGATPKVPEEDDKPKPKPKVQPVVGRRGGGPCGSKEGPCAADNDFSLLKCIGVVDASTQCHCTNGTKGHECKADCPGQSVCMSPLVYTSAATQVEQRQGGLNEVIGTSYRNAQFEGPPTGCASRGFFKPRGPQLATSPCGGSKVPYPSTRMIPEIPHCKASQWQDFQPPAVSLGPSGLPSEIRTSPPQSFPPGSIPPGSIPCGSIPPGSIPPGSMPPGSMPPGSMPPGSMPPGSIPCGSIPPGSIPPGSMPPGSIPRGSTPCGSIPPGSKYFESRGCGSSLALPPSVGVGIGNGGYPVDGGGMTGRASAPCDSIAKLRPPCEQKPDSSLKPSREVQCEPPTILQLGPPCEQKPDSGLKLREVQCEPPTILQCGPPCNTGVGGSGGFNASGPMVGPVGGSGGFNASGPMVGPVGGSGGLNASGPMVGPVGGGAEMKAPLGGSVRMNAQNTCGSLQPRNHPTMVEGSSQFGGPQMAAGRPRGCGVCGVDKSVQCGQMRRNVTCNMMLQNAGGTGADLSNRPRRWSVSTQCGGMNTQHGNNTFSQVNVGGAPCCKSVARRQSMHFDSIPGGFGAGVNVPLQKPDETPEGWPGGIGPKEPPPWDLVTQVWPEELLPWVGWNLNKLSMYGVPCDPPPPMTCTSGFKMSYQEKMRLAHIRQRQWGIDESRRMRRERTQGSRRSRASSRRSSAANSRSSRGSRRSRAPSRASRQSRASTQSKPSKQGSMQAQRPTRSQGSMQAQRSTQSQGSMQAQRSTQSQGSMQAQRSTQSQGSMQAQRSTQSKASKGSVQSGGKSTLVSTKSG